MSGVQISDILQHITGNTDSRLQRDIIRYYKARASIGTISDAKERESGQQTEPEKDGWHVSQKKPVG